jgi:D-alanyl-lipoteichoic acid acyltransferase DltB (MBOAT superfamily)
LIDAPYASEPLTLGRYFAYTTAVWTLIAGPIQRYPEFILGLARVRRPNEQLLLLCAHRITTGVIKAFLLAPMFLTASKPVSLEGAGIDLAQGLLAFYAYFIFLYLDFSGYTDIVIAAASLCGFDTIPENFNQPYLARNVQEFWTRWHISLSTWFRDFFFTPLLRTLGEATQWCSFFAVNVVALFITFIAVGAWHGPGLNFIIFGLLQAMGVVAAVAFRSARQALLGAERADRLDRNPLVSMLAMLLCFHYTCASFLLLDNSVDNVWNYLIEMYKIILGDS